jgi:hypothetical protein
MSDFVVGYWNFMTRKLPTHETIRGIDAIPNFESKVLVWTLFFTVVFFIIPMIAKIVAPSWHASLPARKQREYPAYMVCLIHHGFMVPRAWVHIYSDALRSAAELSVIHYANVEATIAPFCLGYLLGDTICFAIPEVIRGNLEYIIHHVLVSWLVVASLFSSGHMTRFIPHLLLSDTTNIFFNTAWLLRTFGYQDTPIVTILEILFAISFLIARVINMPFAFWAIYHCDYAEGLGYARYTLAPIAILQWYWFYKIVSSLGSRFGGKKKNAKGTDGKGHQD